MSGVNLQMYEPQVCLATQLAHLGSCVPAKSMELTPADAIFVRMGARDSIVSGQVGRDPKPLIPLPHLAPNSNGWAQ